MHKTNETKLLPFKINTLNYYPTRFTTCRKEYLSLLQAEKLKWSDLWASCLQFTNTTMAELSV